MGTAQHSNSVSIGGRAISGQSTVQADSITVKDIALPAGNAGELTTRTDSSNGVITTDAAHGITDGDEVDVFWDGGRRYGMIAGTSPPIAGMVIPVASGAGDNLPDAATEVVIVKQVNIAIALDGDEAELVVHKLETTDPSLTTKGRLGFFDVNDNLIAGFDLTANRTPTVFNNANGDSNPYTGEPITYARASNANPTQAATLLIGVAQDATP